MVSYILYWSLANNGVQIIGNSRLNKKVWIKIQRTVRFAGYLKYLMWRNKYRCADSKLRIYMQNSCQASFDLQRTYKCYKNTYVGRGLYKWEPSEWSMGWRYFTGLEATHDERSINSKTHVSFLEIETNLFL